MSFGHNSKKAKGIHNFGVDLAISITHTSIGEVYQNCNSQENNVFTMQVYKTNLKKKNRTCFNVEYSSSKIMVKDEKNKKLFNQLPTEQ